MTIRLPEPNLCDKFLKMLGKKRGVKIPAGAYGKFGLHASIMAQKESFWQALLRSGNERLPEGLIDVFFLDQLQDADPEDK
jgi:hypothetical protein